jgi:hypothetical protein
MIHNLHILINPDPVDPTIQARAVLEGHLIAEHRRGLHPWGSMVRECPLCQLNK